MIPNIEDENYNKNPTVWQKNYDNRSKDVKMISFDDALQVIGFGKVQLYVLCACGLILMAVINETMGIGFIIPAAQCDLNLTSGDKGILSAVSFLGIMISSHPWGYIADTRGRRKLIIYTILSSILCSILSSIAVNFWTLVVIRLITGLCISGSSSAIYAYLGEFNTNKNRSTIISWASVCVGFAATYLPATAWYILPQTWSLPIYEGLIFRPWRLLLLIYAIPGLIGAICLFFLPESPKFLLSQGRDDEALAALRWIYEKNTKESGLVFPFQNLIPEIDKDRIENLKNKKGCSAIMFSIWYQTVPLIQKPHLLYFSVCCFLQFGIFFTSGGLGLWLPEMSNRIASTNKTGSMCNTIAASFSKNIIELDEMITYDSECNDAINVQMFTYTLILGISYIIAYILIGFLMKPIGRFNLIILCFSSSATCGLLLYWITDPTIIIILLCCFIVQAGICISIVSGTVVDLFPTHLRAMAVCITLMCGRLGTVTGTNIIGLLLETNCDLTFGVFIIVVIVCLLFSLVLPRK